MNTAAGDGFAPAAAFRPAAAADRSSQGFSMASNRAAEADPVNSMTAPRAQSPAFATASGEEASPAARETRSPNDFDAFFEELGSQADLNRTRRELFGIA